MMDEGRFLGTLGPPWNPSYQPSIEGREVDQVKRKMVVKMDKETPET